MQRIAGLISGAPKEAGKTTLALRCTPEGPNLVLNYDIGSVFAPPGTDEKQVYVQSYPAGQYSGPLGSIKRPGEVGDQIWKDALEINAAFHEKRPIKLKDWREGKEGQVREFPLPKTLIMDGLVALDNHIQNALLANNGASTVDDFTDQWNKPNPQKFWNERLFVMNAIYDMLLPLPCNVIAITWESKEQKNVIKDGKVKLEPTGKVQPDCGGKLDTQMPGKVDASIYCYYDDKMQRYFVQTNTSTTIKSTNVRGRFNQTSNIIDVTLSKNAVNPWIAIMGWSNNGNKKI